MAIDLTTECPYCSAPQVRAIDISYTGTRRGVVICHSNIGGCGKPYVIEYYTPPTEITSLKIEGYEDLKMPAMA